MALALRMYSYLRDYAFVILSLYYVGTKEYAAIAVYSFPFFSIVFPRLFVFLLLAYNVNID